MFREVDYVHMLLDRRVDGMIFIPCEMTNLGGEHDYYGASSTRARGSSSWNGALDGLEAAGVSVDERHAGYVATQHLISLGHRRDRVRRRAGALPADARRRRWAERGAP